MLREEHMLKLIKNKILRCVFEYKRGENRGLRSLTTLIVCTVNLLVTLMNCRRSEWPGQVDRMGEGMNAFNILRVKL